MRGRELVAIDWADAGSTIGRWAGNKFRLVARVEYRLGRIYIRRVLTHQEYDKDDWKDDSWI